MIAVLAHLVARILRFDSIGSIAEHVQLFSAGEGSAEHTYSNDASGLAFDRRSSRKEKLLDVKILRKEFCLMIHSLAIWEFLRRRLFRFLFVVVQKTRSKQGKQVHVQKL